MSIEGVINLLGMQLNNINSLIMRALTLYIKIPISKSTKSVGVYNLTAQAELVMTMMDVVVLAVSYSELPCCSVLQSM